MTPDDVRQQIEVQAVELIRKKLADGSMTKERAQQAARVVLDTLKPGMTMDGLYRAIAKLDDMVQELAPIVLSKMKQYEHDIVLPVKEHVKNLIMQGQYNAASTLAKQAIRQEVKIQHVGSANISAI